jgi:hypothetical protein
MECWSVGVVREKSIPIIPSLQRHVSDFMNDILNKPLVLVLNRNRQAVNP